jgi:DNA-binding IclR family transcriptional regulator
MGHALDPKKIKSAQRVLEVLEYFNADRPEGTVMDIARTYGYPQSSTSELLSCLVALGYLRRDLYARTYKPSARVAVLGAWIQPSLFRKGNLLPLMDELAADAEATVMLTSKVGLDVQVFHVVTPAEGERVDVKVGDSALLLHSAPGKALLTTLGVEHVRKLVHRLNAESPEHLRVRFDELQAELDQVRANGYAVSRIDEERAMVSVMLPQSGAEEPLALTICASPAAVEANLELYVRLLRAAISRRLGLVAVDRIGEPAELPRPAAEARADALRQFG